MVEAAKLRKRDKRLDGLKGVAIVCVVIYHTMGQYWITGPELAMALRSFVGSFMLPLFAFLSGYVLSRPSEFVPEDYFVRRTLGLMVPYVVWETIYGLLYHPQLRTNGSQFLHYLLATFANPHLEGRMWYLYMLWISVMLLGVVRLLGDRTWLAVLSIPLVNALAVGEFRAVVWVYSFVVAGTIAWRAQAFLERHTREIFVVSTVAFVALWSLPRIFDLSLHGEAIRGYNDAFVADITGLFFWAWAVGLAGLMALYAASHIWPGAFEGILARIGILSFGIYVSHFLFVELWHDVSPWYAPAIVFAVLLGAWLVTILVNSWRVTAAILLGERWAPRHVPAAECETETL